MPIKGVSDYITDIIMPCVAFFYIIFTFWLIAKLSSGLIFSPESRNTNFRFGRFLLIFILIFFHFEV